MTGDSGSADSDMHLTSASNPIDIANPPDGTSSGLGEVVLPQGCTIDASGTIDTVNFPGLHNKLTHIYGRLSGSATEVEGTVSGDSWSVTGIPGAHWSPAGLVQTVSIRGVFSSGTSGDVTNQKQFISRSGYSSCQYYSFGPGPGTLPIEVVIPRYFRVSAEFGIQQSFGLMAGGLLSLESLNLAYDAVTSTPECPVWRDIGLPPTLGSWMLRVIRTGQCCYEARLSYQSSTETCILPASILMTRNWCFRKRNQLHGSLDIGRSKTDVTLTVEPL